MNAAIKMLLIFAPAFVGTVPPPGSMFLIADNDDLFITDDGNFIVTD